MADEKKQAPEDRISELEGLLKAVEATHAAQAKRGDELEKKNRELNKRLVEQTARAERAEATAQQGDRVILGGKTYGITGTFRADSTFVEVKRGHCEEGATLVAIDKAH